MQDLRRELEKLTEEKSEILDRLNQIGAKSEREMYVAISTLPSLPSFRRVTLGDQEKRERIGQMMEK